MRDNAALTRRFFAESDRGRTPADLCSASFTAHLPGMPPMDLDDYQQFVRLFRSPFAELNHVIDEVVGFGTAIAVRLRLEGTHTGDFMGIPASGRPFSVPGAAFLHIVDGVITEFWGLFDQMGLMRQIGDQTSPTPHRGADMSQQISFASFRGNAAENYEQYFVPAIGEPVATDLVDRAALQPGERVVDLACGTGVVARLAADRVGAAGAVAGVDINAGMLAVARTSSPPSIEWHEAGAESLPLSDEAFDVALCSLGLQFLTDRPAALQEVARVLVPGGRVALNAPGPMPEIFAVLESELARHTGADAAAFVRRVFSIHDSAEIQGLLGDAGFHDIEVEATTITLHLPEPREFLWQYLHSTPLAAAAGKLDDRQRAALEHDVVQRWRPMTDGDHLRLDLAIAIAAARA
jgi:ubiquinone/menaquinone biosynthesis C-methylase UbiE/predicted ester cyclase